MGSGGPGVPALVACLLCGTLILYASELAHVCVHVWLCALRRKGSAAGTASSPLRVLRAVKFDSSPGLARNIWLNYEGRRKTPMASQSASDYPGLYWRWRCCHGGGFPLQYVRTCFMTHSFLTLGFITYDDVYITIGVYIFIRKILWSCTVVFLLMSVYFTMYLVRDDLINRWNQIYRQVSDIRRSLEGNKIVDHSDVVGASPVGAAPTTSSFST